MVAARGLDLASGMSGPELRLEAAGHPMTVSTVSSRTGSHGGRSAETHAQVAFGSDDLFGFQVLAHGHPVRAIGGLQGMLLRKGLADALKRAKTDAERRSIESVRFLSESAVTTLPTEIAELCELRSNDPTRAVQLLGAPGVPGALRELDRLVRAWEWTLYPAKLSGRMELTVNLPGGCSDTEVIRTVRTLQTAALEALGEAKAA